MSDVSVTLDKADGGEITLRVGDTIKTGSTRGQVSSIEVDEYGLDLEVEWLG